MEAVSWTIEDAVRLSALFESTSLSRSSGGDSCNGTAAAAVAAFAATAPP
jgi:hypothetical protein